MRHDKIQPTGWGLAEHPSTELLRQYEEGTLPPSANYDLERHLLDCEMCDDILTGMQLTDRRRTEQVRRHVWQRLRTRLRRKSYRKPLHVLTDWRVALGLLMMFSSLGLILFYQYTRTEAQREASRQTAEALPPSPEELLARTIDAALVLDIPAPPGRHARPPQKQTQNSTVTGQLIDAQGQGIANALLQVQGSATTTRSDAAGRFQLMLPTGAYTLLITAPGRTPQTFSISSPVSDMPIEFN